MFLCLEFGVLALSRGTTLCVCVPECVRECLPVGEGGVKLLVLLYMLYYIDGAVCVCVCVCVCV